MPKTIVSPLEYSEDEYNIVALLSEQATSKVVALQNRLKQILGNNVWLTPANCLHITLMEVICDTEYRNLSRAQYFKRWHEKYNRLTKEVIATFPAFDVLFSGVQISRGAIIIKSPDPKSFNNIRDKLLLEIELPPGTKTPPDIAHCTIARYTKALDLEDVLHRTTELEIDLTEHITQLTLMKDLVPPDFNPTVIERYELSSGANHIHPLVR